MTAHGTEKMSGEIPEDVLHPLEGVEIGAQARLTQIASAHWEFHWVTLCETSII